MVTFMIRYVFLLFVSSTISLTYANDLITYGKACLVKENRLNQAKIKLDNLSRRTNDAQIESNQAWQTIKHYQTAKAQLETSMTECTQTTPNSAYCHQVRLRYNELTYRIENAKADAPEGLYHPDGSSNDVEITKANFKQRHDTFIALCRDSDTHYALLQDPNAYAAVCSSDAARQSVTCSLF